jgi:aminopeptidase-like protein
MHDLIKTLYPICRSITGDGVRQTLDILRQYAPIVMHEVPSGTAVFDWIVPKEWNVRDAYIKNSKGVRVVDFNASNLHVLGYSLPLRTTLRLKELEPHLITLPEHPDWIPYRTSYYKESWGFCLSHNQLLALSDDRYEVCIDASLREGSLTYGECFVPGEVEDEILISCHVCHPSLCNDNLSGIAVATHLARERAKTSARLSCRFLFVPGTIGSIAWLARNESRLANIKAGFVLAGVGDAGRLTYKCTRRGDSLVDTAFRHVLRHSGAEHAVREFSPYGYDERQFCSPGFDLPVGCVMRTPFGEYPEYHTSADNVDFVVPSSLADTLSQCQKVMDVVDQNCTYMNLNPKCEPQLGKRGLYGAIGAQALSQQREMALLWVLNLSDGVHDLLNIADRSGLEFSVIRKAADDLLHHALLAEIA